MPRPRRSYSPAQRADVAARFAAGQTLAQVVKETGYPFGTVALMKAATRSLDIIQPYRQQVLADAKIYASQAWRTLDTMLALLGDEEYLKTHGDHVFALASAHRVVAETLGRILAAAGE